MLAGFGFSGLVGPLACFGLEGWSLLNIGKAIIAFVVAPVAFGIIFNRVFTKIVPINDPEDYRLNFS